VLLGCVLSVAAVPAPGQEERPEEKKAWQEAELKKLQGRWATVREEKTDEKTSRTRRVELEFADGRMQLRLLDEKRKETWSGALQVLGVEQVGPVARLDLGSGGQKKAEVYYDLVGDKLTLVGRIVPRPFEGFPLSGEYARPDRLK
jgi:hypothetical protein